MSAAARAFLYLLIMTGANCLILAPAVFSARYRTPPRIIAALAAAAVVTVMFTVMFDLEVLG